MQLTRNWRREIYNQWGIHTVDRCKESLGSLLWTTRCSRTKLASIGTPQELYVSPLNLYFYKFTRGCGLRFGVISDLYGLHLDDERLPYYDVHPSVLSPQDKRALGKTVRRKALAAGYDTLAFYSVSPLMSVPYFEILALSDLNIYFTTTLHAEGVGRG